MQYHYNRHQHKQGVHYMTILQSNYSEDEQLTIADTLHHCAKEGKYKDCGELAKHCSYLGGSYKVMAWIDNLCLTSNLYTGDVS
jgi:hypothetical protein